MSNGVRYNILIPLGLLVVANGVILLDAPPMLRYGAAVLLLAFLPGWGWIQAFFARELLPHEQGMLAVGLSLVIVIFGVMAVVYLPPVPLTVTSVLWLANLSAGAGLIAMWLMPASQSEIAPEHIGQSRLVLALIALILTVPFIRLGYAEFHEDEAEALMLGVRLLQGEDYALFLHRKGPAQMLIPVAFWLLADRITETLARFPFALSSILSVLTVYALGVRWFGRAGGLMAAVLWLVCGYSVAFGRMVQYQALIFFLGPLAIFCLYLAWRENRPRWIIPAAMLLAASLMAHFDALLLLPVAGYVTWLAVMQSPSRAKWLCALGAGMLFTGLLASFYVPYLNDPAFESTAAYLTESRIGTGWLYNNLDVMHNLDQDYSSRFYGPLLLIGMISFIIWNVWQSPTPLRLGIGAAMVGLLLISWAFGAVRDVAWLGVVWFVVGGLSFIIWPSVEAKIAWLLVGIPFVGYVFLVDDPRTHLYILYPGAALVAGAGWSFLIVQKQWAVRFGAVVVSVLLLGAGVGYLRLVFMLPESRYEPLHATWEESLWAAVYNKPPDPRSYFGYPRREGWKAIGALRAERAERHFPGDFRSVNEDFIVPIWYNFGEPRSCYNTPAYFFVRGTLSPAAGYHHVATITREDEVRLTVFGRESVSEPLTYALDDLENRFDELATPARFIQQAEPAQPVGTRFGAAIVFSGYELLTPAVSPGETLALDLYWQALAPPGETYRAFVHLIGSDGTLLSQQDESPVCRLPTDLWRAGQRGVGQFRLPIPADAPPGRYSLIVGLYHADTLARLPITAGTGQSGDDFLWLRDIAVE